VATFEVHGYVAAFWRGYSMFVVESDSARAARKASRLMFFALLVLIGGPYVVSSMHFYIKPRKPIPPGFRILGFPRPKQ
jgi:hypothetical protein